MKKDPSMALRHIIEPYSSHYLRWSIIWRLMAQEDVTYSPDSFSTRHTRKVVLLLRAPYLGGTILAAVIAAQIVAWSNGGL